MYQYSITKEDSEEIEKLTTASSEITNKFKEVDEKYETTLNSNREIKYNAPEFEKMTYTAPTNEEVKTKAENSLHEYKNSNIDAINEKYDSKITNIENQVEGKKKTLTSEKQELEELYGSLKQNASNEAQKRGLSRSSIIVNQLQAFDKDKLNKYMKLNEEFKTSLSELDSEKEVLENQKNSALSSFDITYAIKLQDKIDSINSEIKEKEKEVLKYNNEIAEKEAKFAKEYEEMANELVRQDKLDTMNLMEYLSKYGTTALDELKAREKYKIVDEALKNLTKEQALNEINSNSKIKSELGKYYDKLILEVKSRE